MGLFEILVRKACRAEHQYIEHSSDTRLTCGAIVSGCLQRVGSGPEKLNALRRRLEDAQQHLPGCRSFRRQVSKLFSEGRLSGGIPDQVHMNVSSAHHDALFELMPLDYSLYELWALSAQDASIRHPEAFGSVTNVDAWKEKRAKLKAGRDELFARVSQEFAPSDTIVGKPRSDGSVLVYFRLAPAVLVHPLGGCAERLVNHLLSKDPEGWTVEVDEMPAKAKRRKTQTQEVAMG